LKKYKGKEDVLVKKLHRKYKGEAPSKKKKSRKT